MSSKRYYQLLIGTIFASLFAFGMSVYSFHEGYMINKHYTSLARMAKVDINKGSELLKEGFHKQGKYNERSTLYAATALTVPAIFFAVCYLMLYSPVMRKSVRSLMSINSQENEVYIALNKSVGVYFLILFCIAFSFFFLIPLLIVVYNLIFPPVTGKRTTFFLIAALLVILALAAISCALFRKGKVQIPLGIMIFDLLLLVYGVPVFIVENNHQLLHKQLIDGPVPDYITLSAQTESLILSLCEFFNFIGSKAILYATLFMFIYLGVQFYFWRKRRRMVFVGDG
jgi:hypothetical protein